MHHEEYSCVGNQDQCLWWLCWFACNLKVIFYMPLEYSVCRFVIALLVSWCMFSCLYWYTARLNYNGVLWRGKSQSDYLQKQSDIAEQLGVSQSGISRMILKMSLTCYSMPLDNENSHYSTPS